MAKFIKWIAAFDNHGDHANQNALKAFFRFQADFKPTLKIHGGDCFEFAALRKGASAEEKQQGIHNDVSEGCDFLHRFAPDYWLWGNHDARLSDLQNDKTADEKLKEYCCQLEVQIKEAAGKARMFPYCKRKGILEIGDTKFMHGYGHGLNAARQLARVYTKAVMGHVHASDYASEAGHPHRKEGWTSGALCDLDARYNRGHINTLRQSHGWTYGLYYPNQKRTVVWQAHRVDGIGWILPSEINHYA